MYLEEIAVLHCNYYHGNIHAFVLTTCISSKFSECISAIKRIFCTIEMYLSPSSIVYLCCFLFPAMHVKSAAFCVWEWRRYIKQLWQLWSQRSRVRRFLPTQLRFSSKKDQIWFSPGIVSTNTKRQFCLLSNFIFQLNVETILAPWWKKLAGTQDMHLFSLCLNCIS